MSNVTFLTSTASLKMEQLKKIAAAWGIVPTGDKRRRETWINAVETERQRRAAAVATAAAPVTGLTPIEQTIYNVLVSKVYRNFQGEAGIAMAKYLAKVEATPDAKRQPCDRRPQGDRTV